MPHSYAPQFRAMVVGQVRSGRRVAEVARYLEISEPTYHRWRNQFGGMKADDAKRLKELERENARLKKIVADKEIELDVLREVAKGNF
jgi:putative transposase